MDVVVDGHLILSQEKNQAEQTPETSWRNGEFDESELAFLTSAIASINARNRIARSSLRTFDTTRRTAALERNDPVEANSFAVETDNFSSSPLMVQLNFFERSH